MKKQILILMATYNGEKYIKEQIESLLNQSNKNWDLLISDDNSNDNTIKIIENYCKRYENIKLLQHIPENGALGNFSYLIKEAKKLNYDYFMLCDQDDFWLKDKIDKTLNFMKIKEKNKPILVFTDKEYVDNKLKKLGYSLGKYNKFDLVILLHQNTIYGCTMMINKKLLEKLDDKIPKQFMNHDHYIAIVAKLLGEIYYLDYKSILYRQHGKNVSGNIKKSIFQKIRDKTIYRENIKLFLFIVNFIDRKYMNLLDEKTYLMIKEINGKAQNGGIKGLYYLIKNNIRKNTFKGSCRFWMEFYIWRK